MAVIKSRESSHSQWHLLLTRHYFFIYVDKEDGEIRRFTPKRLPIENGDYKAILTTPGVMSYLVINPAKGKFGWTKDIARGKRSAKKHFPNCEGIDRKDNYLYFVCKARKEMFTLNLDDRTYVKTSTESGALDGQPDQIVRLTDEGHPLLYFTEDVSISGLEFLSFMSFIVVFDHFHHFSRVSWSN